jgi:hypothetical protein
MDDHSPNAQKVQETLELLAHHADTGADAQTHIAEALAELRASLSPLCVTDPGLLRDCAGYLSAMSRRYGGSVWMVVEAPTPAGPQFFLMNCAREVQACVPPSATIACAAGLITQPEIKKAARPRLQVVWPSTDTPTLDLDFDI